MKDLQREYGAVCAEINKAEAKLKKIQVMLLHLPKNANPVLAASLVGKAHRLGRQLGALYSRRKFLSEKLERFYKRMISKRKEKSKKIQKWKAVQRSRRR